MSLEEEAVNNFKEYLRIPSISPDCDYNGCVELIKRLAEDIGLALNVEWVAPDKPVVVASWQGSEPALASLLLSSHMDVVPVFADMWTHGPFAAEEDDEGNIYARGTQDMKCVGIQYLEAVRRLILKGFQPKRSVHICFTPDEEVGSLGMKKFVETEFFKQLNIGCALDEGGGNLSDDFLLFYAELTCNAFTIVCPGTPGHGSLLHDNTAGEKIAVVIDRVMAKRAAFKEKSCGPVYHGTVTSINLTMLEGGVQTNVVPPEMKVSFDCRVHPDTDIEEFEKWILGVCAEAGEGVRLENPLKKDIPSPTKLTADNPWWTALKNQFDLMGLKIHPIVCPGGTDSRFLRKLGIPAFGFSPMNHTQAKPHDHDEFLNRKIFLKGIEIYMDIIPALTSL